MIPCATCGAEPTGSFNDGSPNYRCHLTSEIPHVPIKPEQAHPAYRKAIGLGEGDRVVVTLNAQELREADECGADRLAAAKRKRRKDYLGVDSLDSHVLGALGERAFSKWIDEPWICHMDGFRGAADIRGCQIRAVPSTNSELKVRKDDPDRRPVVLVVAKRGRCWIRGWVFAAEARRHSEWLGDPGGRGRPAHFVPVGHLRSMAGFLDDNGVRAAMGRPPAEERRAEPA